VECWSSHEGVWGYMIEETVFYQPNTYLITSKISTYGKRPNHIPEQGEQERSKGSIDMRKTVIDWYYVQLRTGNTGFYTSTNRDIGHQMEKVE